MNSLLFCNDPSSLPPMKNSKALANEFNQFFKDKVQKIMDNLAPTEDNPTDQQYLESDYTTDKRFREFIPVNSDKIARIIRTALPKSCELDLVPSKILKQVWEDISPLIAAIVYTSLTSGVFLGNLKNALLRPLPKIATLEVTVLKNFRPVSNLSYLSKLIERVVCKQLTDFAAKSGNLEDYQSAYRQGHSTETALLKVKDDILTAIDNQEVMCLVLLDLSAAFDTVLHLLLLNWLQYRFGFTDTILEWIGSYLSGRTQQVVIDGAEGQPQGQSDQVTLTFGVPQGSVLGPILFTSPLGDLCQKHNMLVHLYADDMRFYMSFKPSVPEDKILCKTRIERCIKEIRTWTRTNLLKLNDDKMEFPMLGTDQQLWKSGKMTIVIGSDEINPTDFVWNLGFYFDKWMKNPVHVNKLASYTYLMLKQIMRVHHKINFPAAKILVQSIVLSWVDYCNSLLLHTFQYNLKKLQRIQNMGAWIIHHSSKYDRITPLLQELHWLMIDDHITYKIAVIMYKCVNGTAPKYLTDLAVTLHGIKLCSSSRRKLPVSRFKTALSHNSSFWSMGPWIWNSLPRSVTDAEDINVFKTNLKTFLFHCSYRLYIYIIHLSYM